MGPFLQKVMLARKEQHLHSALSLPNGSVAGPRAINGCGNGDHCPEGKQVLRQY
jgi:hypothetical protein